MIKRLNLVSKELILGILLCGGVFQAAFMWIAVSKFKFTTGLWIGIGISIFLALHMNWSIENALEMDEQHAVSHMRRNSVLRAIVVAVLFFGSYFFRLGDVVAIFLGLFGLKIGAYLQPLLHLVLEKIKHKKIRKKEEEMWEV